MNVITYYEDLKWCNPQTDNRSLLEKWRESWRKRGWNPITLSVRHARKNQFYDKSKVESQNSIFHLYNPVNKKPFRELSFFYNLSCYRRLFAYSQFVIDNGATMISDFDVMNYSWTPDMMRGVSENTIFIGERCAWFLGLEGAKEINEALMSFSKESSPVEVKHGHEKIGYPHYSTLDIDVMEHYNKHFFKILRTHEHDACDFDKFHFYITNIQQGSDDNFQKILQSIPLIHFDHGCYGAKGVKREMLRSEVVDFIRKI